MNIQQVLSEYLPRLMPILSFVVVIFSALPLVHFLQKKEWSPLFHSLFLTTAIFYIAVEGLNKFNDDFGRPECFFGITMMGIALCGVPSLINSIRKTVNRIVILIASILGLLLSSLFFQHSMYSALSMVCVALFVPEIMMAINRKPQNESRQTAPALPPATWKRILLSMLSGAGILVILCIGMQDRFSAQMFSRSFDAMFLWFIFIFGILTLLLFLVYVLCLSHTQMSDRWIPYLFVAPVCIFLLKLIGDIQAFAEADMGLDFFRYAMNDYWGSILFQLMMIAGYIFSFVYLLKGNTVKRPVIIVQVVGLAQIVVISGNLFHPEIFFGEWRGTAMLCILSSLLISLLFPFEKILTAPKSRYSPSVYDPEKELLALNRQYANGLITPEAYQAQRAEILKQLSLSLKQ